MSLFRSFKAGFVAQGGVAVDERPAVATPLAISAMCARVLDDEQPRDMPLHGRGDERGSGLCGGLRASGDVGRLAEDFAGRVDHHRPQVEADAGRELRQAPVR